jgi:hypothetical protein
MSWDTWEAAVKSDLEAFLGVSRSTADEAAEGLAAITRNRLEDAFVEFGGGGAGDVVGPASATDNAIARYDGTTGKLLQNSSWTIDDAGLMTGASLTITTALSFSSATVNFSGATISNLSVSSVTGAEATANKGNANGYAELNSGGQVPVTQLGTGSGTAATWLNGVGAFDAPTAAEVGAQPADSHLTQIASESAAAAEGDVLLFDGAAWQALQELRYLGGLQFGMGTDGSITLDGSTSFVVGGSTITWSAGVATLDRDWYGAVITVTASCTIVVPGFNVHLRKLVVASGVTLTMRDNGNNAASLTGGSGLLGTNSSTARTSGAGAAGRSTAGAGSNASNITSPGIGGAGGAGGSAGSGGGSGGTVAFTSSSQIDSGRPSGPMALITGKTLGGAAWKGGAGGGGGANSVGTGNSGAGGGGGGVIRISVALLVLDGNLVVEANGGNGSNATGANNGGGGGGGGGYAGLMTAARRGNAPTVQANGGTGGNGIGTGSNGSAGSTGTVDNLNNGA